MDSPSAMNYEIDLKMEAAKFAQVYNYIIVDSINGKPMKAFTIERSKKRKGLLAPKVEIISLEPGNYEIIAYGKTYQTNPTKLTVEVEAEKFYCLGAAEDGLFLEERPYEWTL